MCMLRLLLSLGELKTVIFCTALSRTVHDTRFADVNEIQLF